MTFEEWLAAQGTLFAACDAVTYGQKVWDAATKIEREACAKVCDMHTVDDALVGVDIAQSCAAMIRERDAMGAILARGDK